MQSGERLLISITAIRDFTRVGVPMPETCAYLAKIQKHDRDIWLSIAKATAAGSSLAKALTHHRLWPAWTIAAVTAGEVSGKLPDVLDKVRGFLLDQKQIMGVVKTKILVPLGYLLAGAGMFVGFMIGVYPSVTKTIPANKRTGLVAVSDFFIDLYQNHLIATILLALIAGLGAYHFFRQAAVKMWLYRMVDSIPGIGDGMRSIYLGFWARFMAILDEAGDVAFSEMVLIASSLTPSLYHPSFRTMVRDAEKMGLNKAVDDARFTASDPRKKWPLRLTVGLQIAAKTGDIGGPMGSMAPDIVEDGKDQLIKSLTPFNALATAFAAAGIVAPFVGLMLLQLKMAQAMH
ncbi:type II secretion system F family protein [Sinimarinibacterium sp. NLF-5-8]|uniref:type II secretion system F family protein n=1 Tax=Sinimarinibacterium sp. NLF-5-8 TaxID=2698684 RepID=UPI00137B9812|nr:type II secretion system F family protein [Sinimarinibacterium sp. NLF-5-8]QHS09131.1 hypothetical protein GT972_02490 [Sinimarinibacterium sp. NLF-5-8]